MEAEDFFIRLRPLRESAGGSVRRFEVLARARSGDIPGGVLQLPTRESLRKLAASFSRPGEDGHHAARSGPSGKELLFEIGESLRDGLFQGQVRERWAALVGPGARPARPLRLRLELPLSEAGCGTLAEVPWEALLSPADNDDFLVLEPGYSLVRWVEQPFGDEPPLRPERLRVLAIAADVPELPALDLSQEIEALEEAFPADSEVDLEVRREVSVGDLGDLVETLRPHVLHLMGHGGFDEVEGQGHVLLPYGAGRTERVNGDLLALVLKNGLWAPGPEGAAYGSHLRMVFLNTCRSARAAAEAPFAGVATRLVRGGVPAVLAMQFPIHNGPAVAFSSELYRRLAAGESLDEAVLQGRLRAARQQRYCDWVAPALFSRLPEGRLFAEAGARSPRSAATGVRSESGGARRMGSGEERLGGNAEADRAAEGDRSPTGHAVWRGGGLAAAAVLLLSFLLWNLGDGPTRTDPVPWAEDVSATRSADDPSRAGSDEAAVPSAAGVPDETGETADPDGDPPPTSQQRTADLETPPVEIPGDPASTGPTRPRDSEPEADPASSAAGEGASETASSSIADSLAPSALRPVTLERNQVHVFSEQGVTLSFDFLVDSSPEMATLRLQTPTEQAEARALFAGNTGRFEVGAETFAVSLLSVDRRAGRIEVLPPTRVD